MFFVHFFRHRQITAILDTCCHTDQGKPHDCKYSWALHGTQKRWSRMRTTKPSTWTTTTMQPRMDTETVSWWRWGLMCSKTRKRCREHKVDFEVAALIGTETKIVKQVSSRRPVGITWVRMEPRAAALTPKTSDKLSWDPAKAGSLADGTAFSYSIAGHCPWQRRVDRGNRSRDSCRDSEQCRDE